MKAADLEALAVRADQQEASAANEANGAAGEPGPPPGPADSPNYGPIGFALTAFRELACRMLTVESPRVTLSDAHIETCAGVLAPVADKYGLDMSNMFAGPEGAALMIAGPLLWEAGVQLNLEMKAKRAKPVDAAPGAPAAPAAAAAGEA